MPPFRMVRPRRAWTPPKPKPPVYRGPKLLPGPPRGKRGRAASAAATPSFNPLTDFSTDPVHGVWASDPSWSAPADGGAVSSWRNGGSVGTPNFTQGTGSKQPTYRASTAAFNNQPTVQGDGVADNLKCNFADLAQPFWIVMIGSSGDATSTAKVLASSHTTQSGMIYNASGTTLRYAYSGTVANTGVTIDALPHLHVVKSSGTSSSYAMEGTSIWTGNLGTLGLDGATLFSESGAGANYNSGHIAYYAVFDADPTAQPEWPTFEAWALATYGIVVTYDLYGYGHSYVAGSAMAVLEYFDRLIATGLFRRSSNRATSGRKMGVVGNDIRGTSATSWDMAANGVVVIDAVINDVRIEAGDAAGLAYFERQVRSILRMFKSSARVESSTFTESGAGWSTGTSALYSGGSQRVTTTNGDYTEVAFSGDEVYVMLSADGTNAAFTLAVDGGAATTVAQAEYEAAANASVAASVPYVVRVTGAGSGAHTLRITHAGTGGRSLFVDAILTPRTVDQPLVVLVKGVPVTDWGATGDATKLGQFNALLDTVAGEAEFSSFAVVADPNTGWDGGTMLGGDGLHPNDTGAAHYATTIQGVIETALGL